MVIHIPHCLQMCVANGGAKEFKSAFLHVTTNGIGQRSGRRNLAQRCPMVDNGFSVRQKCFQIIAKTAEFFLHCQKALGIGYCCLYFQSIADNSAPVLCGFLRLN